TDFAIRKYPSYAGAWPLLRPDFHRLEDACLAGHAANEKRDLCQISLIQFYHKGEKTISLVLTVITYMIKDIN
ncbi:hypothetical protein, partial [Paenibacillus silvae]|uniref:hypothetical protein n=1 Tax=Paenibacillus silvae TaxID=1325358 RepID=UPI001E3242DD